eukprot:UN04880
MVRAHQQARGIHESYIECTSEGYINYTHLKYLNEYFGDLNTKIGSYGVDLKGAVNSTHEKRSDFFQISMVLIVPSQRQNGFSVFSL